jgi:hypothetical protein
VEFGEDLWSPLKLLIDPKTTEISLKTQTLAEKPPNFPTNSPLPYLPPQSPPTSHSKFIRISSFSNTNPLVILHHINLNRLDHRLPNIFIIKSHEFDFASQSKLFSLSPFCYDLFAAPNHVMLRHSSPECIISKRFSFFCVLGERFSGGEEEVELDE